MTRRFTNFKEYLPCNLPLYSIAITDDSVLNRVYFDRPSRICEYLIYEVESTKLNLRKFDFERVYFISDFTLHLRWYFTTSCYKVRSFDQTLTI